MLPGFKVRQRQVAHQQEDDCKRRGDRHMGPSRCKTIAEHWRQCLRKFNRLYLFRSRQLEGLLNRELGRLC